MKRKSRKLLSVALALCMLIGLMPQFSLPAKAVTAFIADISKGDVVVSSKGITYYDSEGTSQTGTYSSGDSIVITGTTMENTVTVDGVTADITLSGADIQLTADSECAFALKNGAAVNLTLVDTNTLVSGKDCAGLQVPSGTTTTIDGDGSLAATGGVSGAGIGGSSGTACGTVTINGGTITATGTSDNDPETGGIGGAGIGGGSGGAGGTITITGGIVTTDETGWFGSGIGGGACADGGTLTVTGGTINAGSIGYGVNGDGPNDHCYISGGSVYEEKAFYIYSPTQVSAGDDTSVYMTTVTLDGIEAKTAVDSLTVTYNSAPYSYGTDDMYTDASGKLYLWLPEGAAVTGASVGDTFYSGSVTTIATDRDTAAGTLTEYVDVFDYDNAPASDVFSLRVEIAEDGNAFEIPVCGRTDRSDYNIPYNWSVDWGDGSTEENANGSSDFSAGISHGYTNSGTYVITIKPNGTASAGWFRAFGFDSCTYGPNTNTNQQELTGFAGILDDTSMDISNSASNNYIAYEMFHNCSNLAAANIRFTTTAKTVGDYFASDMFSDCSALASLPDKFNLPDGITMVGDYFASAMFSGCTALTSLPGSFNLPSGITSVKSIGNFFATGMFMNCAALTSLPDNFNLPDGITMVGDYFATSMFSGCTALTSLPGSFNLPSGITSFGEVFAAGMFMNCTALTSLPDNFNLPSNIETDNETTNCEGIATYMFYGCTKLKVNSGFKFPNLSQDRINQVQAFYQTFAGITAKQYTGEAANILSNLADSSDDGITKIYPSSDMDTFSEAFNNDKSWNHIHPNWKVTDSVYTIPTITGVTVKSSGDEITITGLIEITFSEAMDTATAGTVTIYDVSTDTDLITLTASDGQWQTNNSNEYVSYFIPYTGLEYSKTYWVKISGFAAAEDGKTIEAVSDGTYSFTTKEKPTVSDSGSVYFNGSVETGENPFYYGAVDGADLVYGNPVSGLSGYSWDKKDKKLTLNGLTLETTVDSDSDTGLAFFYQDSNTIDNINVYGESHSENSYINIIIADDSSNTIKSNGEALYSCSSYLYIYGGDACSGTLTVETTGTRYACFISGAICHFYGGNVILDAPDGTGYISNNCTNYHGGTLLMKGGTAGGRQLYPYFSQPFRLTYSNNYDGSDATVCYIDSSDDFSAATTAAANAKYVYCEEAFIVSYNTNGGTGTAPDSQTGFVSESDATTIADGTGLSKEGYRFNGWNTAKNGSGTSYAAKASYYGTVSVTLYAQWVQNDVSVKSVAAGDSPDVSGSLAITFSEAMSADSGTVKLTNGNNTITLSGGTWSEDGTVYTVDYSKLDYGTKYTVVISDFTAASDGVKLSTDSSHNFTTIYPALTGTATISGDTVSGETLTASLTDSNNTGDPSYQWTRDGENISGATDSTYTLTDDDIGAKIAVKITSSKQTGTLTSVSVGPVADPAVIAAKKAAEGADYSGITQKDAADESATQEAVQAIAEKAVDNSDVTVKVSTVSYTAPVAGTSQDPDGTDGSCTFTVTVSKGEQSETTKQITIGITATAFTDADAVAAAKEALKDGSVDVDYGATQEDKTEAVQSYVDGLLKNASDASGVTAAVTYNSSTGKYDVTLEKGEESDSVSLSMTVKEAADPAIATVSDAKTAAENASYRDMAQADVPDESAAQSAVQAIAEKAVDNSDVTVKVSKVSYTAPVAGTSADTDGTDGSYTFTVTVSKGEQSKTTGEIAIAIAATAFTDADAVAAAKEALKDGSVDVDYSATQEDKTKAVQRYVDGLLKEASDASGVTAAVTCNSATGKYDVTLTKGSESDSVSLSMTVNETSILTGTATISGSAVCGETLTATLENGNSTSTLSYQWTRDGTDITDAAGSTYTLTADDVGAVIAVKITSSTEAGTVTSEGTDTVTKADCETSVTAPALSKKTASSITVISKDGYEYIIVKNGADTSTGTWQDSSSLTALNAGTKYDIYQRIKETSTNYASDISAALTVTTKGTAYAVTYYLNYSEATEPYITQNVYDGEMAVKPDTPVRSGYKFNGWYTESGCSTAWNFKTGTVSADTPLYAGWTAVETLSVTYAKGSADSGSVPKDNTDYASGDTVTVLGNTGNLARSGYSFNGWSDGVATYSAGDTFTVSEDTVLTPTWTENSTTYTVTFSNNYTDGGTYTTQDVTYGSLITAPDAPTRDGYTFVGWYKDAACINPWNFNLDTVTGTMTLYTKWSQETYSVSGIVIDDSSSPSYVEDASVKVMQGNVQFGDTVLTNANGEFTVTGVPSGNYNLVITKGDQTVTLYITVSGGDYEYSGQITLPGGNTNSKLDIIGSGTPNVVENGLHDLFNNKDIYGDTESGAVGNGGTVEIRLTVQEDDSSEEKENVTAQMTAAGYEAGIVMDLDIEKTIIDSSGVISDKSPIEELDDTLTLIIPLPAELQGKNHYVVYRSHDYGGSTGVKVDKITTTETNGEYIEISVDKTYLTLHAKFFSTYAIGYSDSSISDSRSYSSGNQSYLITASAGEGGSISPSGSVSVNKGMDKTFSISAKDGYAISDVLVDGESVGVVSSYTFSNVAEAHTISVVFAAVEGLPYYLDADGNKVFIGFTSDASGEMKYIAPEGKTVLFTPNSKNFTDISGHWAKSYIDFVTEREIFVGTGTDIFSPDAGMTRAMFAAVIGRLYERSYGTISVTGNTFSDVQDGEYYSKYVLWAEENGIIFGIGDNKFAPDREITREEMATILYRFAEFLDVADVSSDTELNYPDSDKIDSWATEAVEYCQESGIILGRTNGYFAPLDTATRAEVATILERFIETVV